MILATQEPIHSFGSSFGPICYDNPSQKSIFEVKEPSFSSYQVEGVPLDIRSFGPSESQEGKYISQTVGPGYASFSKNVTSYPLFNPTDSRPSESSYTYSSKENLFTDPALLEMVREDVNKIMYKTSRNKENKQVN